MNRKRGVLKGRIIAFFIVVLTLAILIGATFKDQIDEVKLGLDLQGGFEVLYEVHPVDEEQEITSEVLSDTVTSLLARIDVLGVSEPNIRTEGENRIRVQLAGVNDEQTARELLSTQAELSFRDVDDNLLLDGSDLVEGGAKQSFHPQTNQPIVSVTLKDADLFGDVTEEVLAKQADGKNQLVIWLDYEEGDSFYEEILKEDSKIVSAPFVWEVLRTKDVMITGDFTVEEAQQLAGILNAGSLPVKLEEIYSNSVGASLGEEAMEKTVFAGMIGIALIFLYMIIVYRFPGVIAVITLSVYIYLVLLIFNLLNAVLTLPGIAALILGVGMAVDANILTYERIKEELRTGKSMLSAFRAGNRRAFATILDANLTSLIAAGVLFYFGTSSIQGFAVMLIVSILTSFITAVYGSRFLLGLWVKSRALNGKYRLFGVKEGEISEL